MSPENVEWGRCLSLARKMLAGSREAVGDDLFRSDRPYKRRRSACGSRKPVNLLFPHVLVGAAALRTSFNRRLDKSRPPLPSWADVKDGRVRPGHDEKAGATPSHLRSGRNMADGGDKGRGGD